MAESSSLAPIPRILICCLGASAGRLADVLRVLCVHRLEREQQTPWVPDPIHLVGTTQDAAQVQREIDQIFKND